MLLRFYLLLSLVLAMAGSPMAHAEEAALSGAQANQLHDSAPKIPWKEGSAPAWREGASSEVASSGTRVFQGLSLCIGAFLIGIYLFKRFSPRGVVRTERRIELLDRMALGQRSAISLIRVDGRLVLVSSGSEPVSIVELKQRETSSELSSFEDLCSEDLRLTA